jgi:hypothetical protein
MRDTTPDVDKAEEADGDKMEEDAEDAEMRRVKEQKAREAAEEKRKSMVLQKSMPRPLQVRVPTSCFSVWVFWAHGICLVRFCTQSTFRPSSRECSPNSPFCNTVHAMSCKYAPCRNKRECAHLNAWVFCLHVRL